MLSYVPVWCDLARGLAVDSEAFMCISVYVCMKLSDLRCVQHLCPLSIRCAKDLQLLYLFLSLCVTGQAFTYSLSHTHTKYLSMKLRYTQDMSV